MREVLVAATEFAILIINALALLIVCVGTVEAVVKSVRMVLAPPAERDPRDVWLWYARWLVGALTFQLAADIIETAISNDWQAIARIAVIALIRAFLNFFLERDLEKARADRGDTAEAPT